MKTEQIRAFLLEKGDEFMMSGSRYKVTDVTKVLIHYVGCYGSYTKNAYSMGVNSRQRVELICKSQPPSKVSYERPEAVYDNKSAMGIADEFHLRA